MAETNDCENLDKRILAGGLSPGDGGDERFALVRGLRARQPRSRPRRNGRSYRGEDQAASLSSSTSSTRTRTARSTTKELHERISDKEWAVADPDNDKTISKDEYLAYVKEVLFKKAHPDNDGTIDAKELSSPAGHALLRLLKSRTREPEAERLASGSCHHVFASVRKAETR